MKKRIKKIKKNSNSNLPKSILDELKNDNISFSDHIYREKYATIENDEEIESNTKQLKLFIESEESKGNSEKTKILKKILKDMESSQKENLAIKKKEFNWAQKESELKRAQEKGTANKELNEERSLKNLIAKHDGNEDAAIAEKTQILKKQGHDDEAVLDILKKEASDIDNERKLDNEWQDKQTKKTEKQNRKEEISNMAASQQALAQMGDAYKNSMLGRGLNSTKNFIAYFFGWFLIILIFSSIIFVVSFSLYNAYSSECSDLQDKEMNAFGKIFAVWQYNEFSRCIRTNLWSSIGTLWNNIDFFKGISKIFNQQVNIATGGMYYAQVDKNAKEPTGLFIKDIEKQEKYFTDEPITISATIDIKTINSEIIGSINGYLNGQACNKVLYPTYGLISVNQNTNEHFICTFEENTIDETKLIPFQIISTFQTKNIAYIRPVFIKKTIWNKYTTEQKKKLESSTKTNTLKDSNSPMRIGGKVGASDDGIVSINDYSENIKTTTFPLTIALQSGEQNNGWTNGKVKKINKLIVILPSSLKIKPDTNGALSENNFLACQGYTLTKESGCSNLNLDDDSYSEFLCLENEIAYSFIQNEDVRTIKSFSEHETIYCLIEGEIDELFKNDDGNNLGLVDDKGIKIYSDYKYNVEKTMKLNIIKRYQSKEEELKQYQCSNNVQEELKGVENEINPEIKTKYSTKYQNLFVSSIDSVDADEKINYEALMAAITHKYNEFKLKNILMYSATSMYSSGSSPLVGNDERHGSFLTGCSLIGNRIVEDDTKLDIKCLFSKIYNINKEVKEPEKILETYYANSKRIDASGKEAEIYSEKATVDDYNKWRYSLCDKSEWKDEEINSEEEANSEEVV